MPGETKNGMQCAEFDSLLSDALDGLCPVQSWRAFKITHGCAPSADLCSRMWPPGNTG